MSGRIHQHLRQNVVGYICLFLILSGGTAYATHPGGANTISTGDIIDDEVRSNDVRDDTLAGGGLAHGDLREASVGSSEVRNDTLPDGGLIAQDLAASSVGPSEVRDDTLSGGGLRAADLRSGSVGGSEVINDSLTGTDVDESSLGQVPDADRLDGNDSSAFPRVFSAADDSFPPGPPNRLQVNATLGALVAVTCDDGGTSGVDGDDTVSIDVLNLDPTPFQVFVERVNAPGNTAGVNSHSLSRYEIPMFSSAGSIPAPISTNRFTISPLGDFQTATIVIEATGMVLPGGSDNCAGIIQATRSN